MFTKLKGLTMSESSDLQEIVILVDIRLKRIEKEVAKLRQAVANGSFDSRSLVGDAVLVIEGQLKQIREEIPKSKDGNEPA